MIGAIDVLEAGRTPLLISHAGEGATSDAQATIFEPEADLYRVNVQRIMAWEYGTVGNRTDWLFEARQ